MAVLASLVLCGSCVHSGLSIPQALPYEVVGSEDQTPYNGRTARHWFVVSGSSTFEEHAHTLARAAQDLHREHGLDLTQVTLYPTKALAGSGFRVAHGFYAADGRAGQGLPGADPDYRATWSVLATREQLTPDDLRIAELWTELSPEYPSTDPLSSVLVDVEALRARIAEELETDVELIQQPHFKLERWIEIAQ
jgi:hypothetical protein